MKNTNTGTGFGGLGNLEALGSKIVGPKISVIKRWFLLLKTVTMNLKFLLLKFC